jgi:hypothetical protein
MYRQRSPHYPSVLASSVEGSATHGHVCSAADCAAWTCLFTAACPAPGHV